MSRCIILTITGAIQQSYSAVRPPAKLGSTAPLENTNKSKEESE